MGSLKWISDGFCDCILTSPKPDKASDIKALVTSKLVSLELRCSKRPCYLIWPSYRWQCCRFAGQISGDSDTKLTPSLTASGIRDSLTFSDLFTYYRVSL